MHVRWSDPRLIFPLVAAALAFGLLKPQTLPIKPQKPVEAVYRFIELLPQGSGVLLALDFDPQSVAELRPITDALMRHCLRRELHVVGMTFNPYGAPLGQDIIQRVARDPEFRGKQDGVDYVYLGYKPGDMVQVITNMGENMQAAFPQDYGNRPTATMPIFRQLKSLKDFNYIVDLSASSTPETWIQFGSDKYHIPMAIGCTAIIGPDMYVRLNAGQINGLVAGLRGAADYETLLGKPGQAVKRMFPQSLIHLLIVAFVIAGNVVFLWMGRRGKEQKQSRG